MKIKIIASGSKGNCSILLCEETNMIIDMGISYLSFKRSLEDNSLSFSDFKGIFITHRHTDHIRGLAALIKHTKINVYIPKEMYPELKEIVPPDRIICLNDCDHIENIDVDLIHTSHDTDCSVGYIISHKHKSIVYVTDTGYINKKYLEKMKEKDAYIIESNHDEEMLMDGPYPYFLKQRVVGDRGHLSNSTTAKYLEKLVGANTKYVVLAHISEKNNTEELALKETTEKIGSMSIKILIARQEEESPLLEV